MKIKSIIYIISIVLGFQYMNAQSTELETVKFVTLGNCFYCQERIEKAVKVLSGVQVVKWSAEQDATTVTFDKSQINIHDIMKRIAFVGHDTEWYQASEFAYSTLVGTCCEYDRTIDYNQVQIGYLSLMGTWVSVEELNQTGITLFPNLIFNAQFNLNIPSNFNNLILNIYDINGNILMSDIKLNSGDNLLNLNSFANGNYFAVISDSTNKAIYKSRIIVQ